MKNFNCNATQLILATLLSALASTTSLSVLAGPTSIDTDTSERYHAGIEKLSREITAAKAHRTALASRMDAVSRELSKLRSEQQHLVADETPTVVHSIDFINQDLTRLQRQIDENNQLHTKQKLLVERLPQPSLLADALASPDARQQHRIMAIQSYLLHKSSTVINQSREKQQQLFSKKVALTLKNRELQGEIEEFQNSVSLLRDTRQSLESQFTHLSSTIVKKQDRLERLKLRINELEFDPEKALFSAHQGQLHDPTEGVLQHRYAEPKARGLLKWEGILVNTPVEQQIEAVFDGTVVFADRMQGLGYVAIVDHGEGYMSLYGMADLLIVEPGQTLLGGDPIGIVGSSEKDQSTLYFEIRHNATTVNPQDWLAFRQISDDN